MNAPLIRKAAALPARQLHLMGGGLLLIVACALWFYALRAPLAALRAVRAEQAQLALVASDPALLSAQLAVLESDSAALSTRFAAGPAATPAQSPLRLVGELGKLAQAQGVTLHAVTPAPDELVLAFVQTGFDAEASGSYAGLLAWMNAVERAQPNLAVTSFDMRPGDTPGKIAMKIRIAAYRPQESKP